jgi:hypothetical protein
MEIRN